MPQIVSLMIVLIFSTAFVTPFPRYLALSPSRSSSASNSPVEPPDGAMPLPTVPSASVTSASTVGLPLESSISLPIIFSISKKFMLRSPSLSPSGLRLPENTPEGVRYIGWNASRCSCFPAGNGFSSSAPVRSPKMIYTIVSCA